MTAREATLQRFDDLLGMVFLDNTEDEAMRLWCYRVQMAPDTARAELEAFEAVLTDPPDDFDEVLAARGGIHLAHVSPEAITPFSAAERDEWLRALVARMRAEL